MVWWSVVVTVVVVVMSGGDGGEGSYVAESFLCDDITAICNQFDLPYDENNTLCETNKESFLSINICNCGTNCIALLGEGEACNTQSVLTYPSKLCASQLYCKPHGNETSEGVCVKNEDLACVRETVQYDEEVEAGTLGPGRYRPQCDEMGRYSARQCSPSATCYCVNEEGERIFGEAPITEYDMDCLCSRYWHEGTHNSNGYNVPVGLRCLPNGNFDALQCIRGRCYCYDRYTNSVTVGPFGFGSLTQMPCYDPAIHTEDYANPCTRSQALWESQGGGDMIIVAEEGRPSCSPDGFYAAVQRQGSNVYCVDVYGDRIENFTSTIDKAGTMTCNCARRRYIMEHNGLGAAKPLCCQNGDYYPWQRRGLLAYCVDKNGNQYGPAVAGTDIQSLLCYTADPCAST